jgi:DsbC/DsbD-like thiol-disulfide interchange protein
MRRLLFSCAVLGLIIGSAGFATTQSAWQPGHAGVGFGQRQGKEWVRMVSSPELSITTGKQRRSPQSVALRFQIQDGLHVNSHTPHSRFLIPTTLTMEPSAGVEIAKIEYPAGVDYHFEFSPKDALSVYTGEFSVTVPIHARPGHYTLRGQLQYQACDNRTCSPPKTLPLTLSVTAR